MRQSLAGLRAQLVQAHGDNQVDDAVAQELEALVIGGARAAVRQCGAQ
jgi:hypothetical protein